MLTDLLSRALNISHHMSIAISHLLSDTLQRPILLEQVRTIENRTKAAIEKIKIRLTENDNDLLLKESLFGYPVSVSKQIQHVMSAAQKQEISVDWAVKVIRQLYDRHQTTIKPPVLKPINIEKSNQYIKEELLPRLGEIESQISAKIETWKKGLAKIECAAFVELLMDKNFFDRQFIVTGKSKNREAFAMNRYSADIKNSLLTTQKVGRSKHTKMLSKYFK